MKKMLLVFAHPDDESFTTGGMVSKYSENGWEIDLCCVTNGERGQTGTYENLSENDLAKIRRNELKRASEVLGISTIYFLDYKDGQLNTQPAGKLENEIFSLMVQTQPDIVVTFEQNGISNHPDHIMLSNACTYAFQKYSKGLITEQKIERRNLSRLPSESEKHMYSIKSGENKMVKLYFVAMPESQAEHLKKIGVLPEVSFGKKWKGTEDKLITTVIDTKKYENRKRKALLCHKSQSQDTEKVLELAGKSFFSQEYFILRMQGQVENFMGKNDKIQNKL